MGTKNVKLLVGQKFNHPVHKVKIGLKETSSQTSFAVKVKIDAKRNSVLLTF